MGRRGSCLLSFAWVGLGLAGLVPASLAAQPESWTEEMAPVRIADDLYYVGTVGLAAFLFTSDDGHVLIDAPMDQNVPAILRSIRAAGFDPEDVRLHLATHAHYDHVGGFAALVRETGSPVRMSERDAPFAVSGEDFGIEGDGFPGFAVGRPVVDGEVIRVGRSTLTAQLTPGHTPGCTSWSGTVTLGGEPRRFVLVCSLSVLSMYRLTGDDPTYPGHGADYCRSLTRLRSLSPDIFLSNHGGFFSLTEKAAAVEAGQSDAFVDAAAYRDFLDSAGRSIEEALTTEGHVGGCSTLVR